MIFNKKYSNTTHVLNILYIVLYRTGNEFVKEIIDSASNCIKEDRDYIKTIVLDILEYALSTDKIKIRTNFTDRDVKEYNSNNYKEILSLLEEEWEALITERNYKYHYGYFIYFTDSWKKELAKIGLWDRSILK